MKERAKKIQPETESNPAISIVMPAYNAEEYIREAIDSIICQSFTDFECIVVDDGSADSTRDIIRAYDDKRIILLENEHDFIGSLNRGMNMAKGKYIARMDADDRMHPDRLKIQHTIMEAEPSITTCSTWMRYFGENSPEGRVASSLSGWVDYPLLSLLQSNFIFHPTIMIRKLFLKENDLHYETYPYAEDFKFWTEIAKKGGTFYIENQPLLYYRISETQVTKQKREEQRNTAEKIQSEIIDYLVTQNRTVYPSLASTQIELIHLYREGLIEHSDMMRFFHTLFQTNKNKLKIA